MGREIAALKLNTNEELQAYVTVAKTALKKGVEELISVCETEFPKFKTKEIPYIQFCDRIVAEASPADKARYIAWRKTICSGERRTIKKHLQICFGIFETS